MTRPALLGIAASCGTAVVLLTVAYHHDPVARWDDELARVVSRDASGALEAVARAVSNLGGGVAMAIVAVSLAGVLAHRGLRADAVYGAVAYAAAQVTTHLLKAVLGRTRPTIEPVVELPSTASFPSGHASVSVAVLVVAAVLLGGGPRRLAVAVVLSAVIGASRVVLGVHWASDVVAGWALGGLVAALVLVVRGRLRRGRYAGPRVRGRQRTARAAARGARGPARLGP